METRSGKKRPDPNPSSSSKTTHTHKKLKATPIDQNVPAELRALSTPKILQSVFSYSVLSSLKSFRSVCKQWNEQASPILGNKSVADTPIVFDIMFYHRARSIAAYNTMKNSSIKELYSNFSINCKSSEWPELKDFMKIHGIYAKSLELCDISDSLDERLPKFHEMITTMCPNLNSLRFDKIEFLNLQPCDAIEEMIFVKPLAITQLTFYSVFIPQLNNYFIRLIQSCPHLIHLDVQSMNQDLEENPEALDFPHFLKKLSKLTQVTKNLKNFEFGNVQTGSENLEILKIVSNMEFSTKLKSIRIGESMDSRIADRNETFLQKLLENVAKSVENITFDGTYNIKSEGEAHNKRDKESFSPMEKVKYLLVQSDDNYGGIITPTFIAKVFPNLVKCVQDRIYDENSLESGDNFLQHNQQQDLQFGNTHLASFVIFRKMYKSSSLARYIELYPNLTNLTITVGINLNLFRDESGCVPHRPSIQLTLLETMRIIRDLKNLKQFTYLFTYNKGFSQKAFCESLKYTKHFKQLEGVNIISCRGGTPMELARIKEGLGFLAGVPCTLRLVRFQMPKKQEEEMIKYCQESSIRLEWHKEDEKCTFRLPSDASYPNYYGSNGYFDTEISYKDFIQFTNITNKKESSDEDDTVTSENESVDGECRPV